METDSSQPADDAPLTHRFIRPVVGWSAVGALGYLLLGVSGECTAYESIECSWVMQWLLRLTMASAVFWVCAGVATMVLLLIDALVLGSRKLMVRTGFRTDV